MGRFTYKIQPLSNNTGNQLRNVGFAVGIFAAGVLANSYDEKVDSFQFSNPSNGDYRVNISPMNVDTRKKLDILGLEIPLSTTRSVKDFRTRETLLEGKLFPNGDIETEDGVQKLNFAHDSAFYDVDIPPFPTYEVMPPEDFDKATSYR